MTLIKRIWPIFGFTYLLILFYLFLMDVNTSQVDFDLSLFDLPIDKVVHFTLYLPFSFIFYKSLEPTLANYSLFKTFIYCILSGFILSITTESLQAINPSRSVSFFDLLANLFGVVMGSLFLILILLFKKRVLK